MSHLLTLVPVAVALGLLAIAPCHAQVLEVSATDYAFRAPAEIPSGWTTIRFTNEGEEPHFILLTQLPDGRSLDEYTTQVGAPFNEAWYRLRDGEIGQAEVGELIGKSVPEWYWTAKFMGGPALVAPNGVAETTVELEPGTYVLECYMKTPDGEFHWMEGMARELIVTDTPSGASPPEADIRITLSNYNMALEGDLTPGTHTVAVEFAEHPEAGFGHNIHVARLMPETDVKEVVRWMNAFELDGLQAPAPATFVGGTQLMPAGYTAYFSLDLDPGRYLFVSEYTGSQGVLQEVTIVP